MNNADIAFLSDAHKDAYGFRPSGDLYRHWATLTDAEIAKVEDDLIAAVERAIDEEKAAHEAAALHFEAHLAGLMADHGIDRATAIRWDIQAEGAEEDVAGYGLSYYAYLNHLPSTYFEGR